MKNEVKEEDTDRIVKMTFEDLAIFAAIKYQFDL